MVVADKAASDRGQWLIAALMRFKPAGMSPNAWALEAGLGRSLWVDLKRHGNPSRRTLERLLKAAGSSLVEFEALRTDKPGSLSDDSSSGLSDPNWGWRGLPLPPLPVYRCEDAGEWGDDRLQSWRVKRPQATLTIARPPSLALDQAAFATRVAGSAMTPRFRTGRMIAISPDRTLAPSDDILVTLTTRDRKSGNLCLPGKFVGHHRDALLLSQYGNGRDGRIPVALVAQLAVIVGELI